MSTRTRILAFGSAALVVIAGLVAGSLIGGTTGGVLVIALAGGGLVVATSLVFLEVGLSEDRARAREQERERGRGGQAAPEAPRRRLGRLRPRRRRPD